MYVCVCTYGNSYRVELREAGITYLNKLGKFLSPHELECTDAKGQKQVTTHTYSSYKPHIHIIILIKLGSIDKRVKVFKLYVWFVCIPQVITSARFVVAVGGRPTPLTCPGAEYAISSDDLFMLVSLHIHTYLLFSC